MPELDEEPLVMLQTQQTESPPGEFVTEDLERDCARFLEELRRRASRVEDFRPPTEK